MGGFGHLGKRNRITEISKQSFQNPFHFLHQKSQFLLFIRSQPPPPTPTVCPAPNLTLHIRWGTRLGCYESLPLSPVFGTLFFNKGYLSFKGLLRPVNSMQLLHQTLRRDVASSCGAPSHSAEGHA